ncbi:PIN domain-containing protein [Streptomyces sp. NPDC003036]|uniref:PIN domain-containing protein n=1 Tax=Streptomyces sp. NPDC003036 TaxID=3154442 RepID=UPI0033BBCE5E
MIVTPIPGARLDLVHQLLREAHTQATNLSNYNSAEEHLLKYLTWVNEQSRLLGSQVRAKDIEALFFTPIYWALLNGAGHLGGQLAPKVTNPLIDQEVRQRIADLERAVESTRDTILQWPEKVSTLVLDTSFFIEHEEKLEDVDFSELAGQHGGVRIAVPMMVVDELDQLKESKVSPQARWRARYGLAVLDRLLTDETMLGFVEVKVLSDPPGHVRLPDEDDEIVDRALALSVLAAGPVKLVTYDTGMALRAKIAGVPYEKLRKELGTEPEQK